VYIFAKRRNAILRPDFPDRDTPVPKPLALDLIAVARSNFMKIAPLYYELVARDWCEPRIVHTGQHYDTNMSDAFFSDLKLPAAPVHLGVGIGSNAELTGRVVMAYARRERELASGGRRTRKDRPGGEHCDRFVRVP
jgi:hypothetical protein